MGFTGLYGRRNDGAGGRQPNRPFPSPTHHTTLNDIASSPQSPPVQLANQSVVYLGGCPPASVYRNPSTPYQPYPYQSQSFTQSSLTLTQQDDYVSSPAWKPDSISQSSYEDAMISDENVVSQAELGDKLSEIISQIDEDSYSLSEAETTITLSQSASSSLPVYDRSNSLPITTPGGGERSLVPARTPRTRGPQPTRTINVLSKLSYYSNSRLPATLPPFRVYVSTYQLLCLAALSSSNAYDSQQNAVPGEHLVLANARMGTKAMVVKSVTCADEKTIVIAVRGTSVLSLRDWNTNLQIAPESPAGFLDDDGNYCHSGFLRVARAMVKPIAARLRHLLEENPNRLDHSLLFTGHSAGGAVASLLYAHVLSEHVKSDLTILSDCFKRVHCITFGSPPISLLPLHKPPGSEHRMKRYLFYSFINEGDPVVRAERSYIISLVDLLLTTPSPTLIHPPRLVNNSNNKNNNNNNKQKVSETSGSGQPLVAAALPFLRVTNRGLFTGPKKQRQNHVNAVTPERPPRPSQSTPTLATSTTKPTWNVPPGTLSNAGRLIVLRGPEPAVKRRASSPSQNDLTKEFEHVQAYTVTDEQLRRVVFGDPLMHAMDVYRRRIEALAMKAITGRETFY